jgi:hypothetical protein
MDFDILAATDDDLCPGGCCHHLSGLAEVNALPAAVGAIDRNPVDDPQWATICGNPTGHEDL